jgi:hypothetical protein
MTGTINDALPWSGQYQKDTERSAETTPGGSSSVPWIVVANNLSPWEAEVIKGRLNSEDIPAIIQQEALGSVLGLTVGPLGSAKVLVPEPLSDKALGILAETFEADEVDDLSGPDEDLTEGC